VSASLESWRAVIDVTIAKTGASLTTRPAMVERGQSGDAGMGAFTAFRGAAAWWRISGRASGASRNVVDKSDLNRGCNVDAFGLSLDMGPGIMNCPVGNFGSRMKGHRFSLRMTTIAVLHLACSAAAVSADAQDVSPAVDEIIGACAILPVEALKPPLSVELEAFLRHSLQQNAAKSNDLTAMLARLPTDKGIDNVADPRARAFFFSAYLNCIRQQTTLKLRSWGVSIE
jgi:hypothetical protein